MIALETYIRSYAGRKLGESYTKKHIDSLSLYSKWIVVPKLATGLGLPSDHQGVELLKKLVKARNSVVHMKAINLDMVAWTDAKSKATRENRAVLEAALRAFECIGLLGKGVLEVDPDERTAEALALFAESPKYSVRYESPT